MKQISITRNWNYRCLLVLLSIGTLQLAFIGTNLISANNTPQSLPSNQNWSNTNLITTDDNWSNVPGIIGYRGDDLITAAGVDPRTVLADGSTTPVDVIANQTNPNGLATGGVAEFEIADPTIAMQGSATSDAPHIVIYLNTTGQNNVRFAANIRDIDGSNDDAVQQVDVQYRVGGTGNYASIPGGYIADATTSGSAAQVTPLNLALPANASNQPLLEIRIITTNAVGNDEWVGVDDISVTADSGGTPTPSPSPRDANVDFDGDGRSDFVVTRPEDGDAPVSWFINNSSVTGGNPLTAVSFGLAGDIIVPEDYDGDGKDDIAVWRRGDQGFFYILESSTLTVRIEPFGQTGDDPRVVTDYDGDGKADVAVYRKIPGGANHFYFRASSNNPNRDITFVPWGGDPNLRPYVGDFDGDGKGDFCVHDTDGMFYLLRSSDLGAEFIRWGNGGDSLVPGDYDGDGRSDFCVVRSENGVRVWYILERDGGGTGAAGIRWGFATDDLTPGDYDGDGRQDIAVRRSNADPAMNFFFVRRSSDGLLTAFNWGRQNDRPAASWYVH